MIGARCLRHHGSKEWCSILWFQCAEQRRVVCFSPEKRSALVNKPRLKSLVTLANVSPQKRKFQPDKTEYLMGKFSRVLPAKNLAFPWKPPAEDRTKVVVPIRQIVNGEEPLGTMVTVKAKVTSRSQSESVYSQNVHKWLMKSDTRFKFGHTSHTLGAKHRRRERRKLLQIWRPAC